MWISLVILTYTNYAIPAHSVTYNVVLWYNSNEYSVKGLDLTFWVLYTISCTGPSFGPLYIMTCRSQWPRGLRRRSTAARLLRSWVRIPPGTWMFVCCECCVLSGRDLCDELITRPEESYRLWCVVVCDLESSWRRRKPRPTEGCCAKKKKYDIEKKL